MQVDLSTHGNTHRTYENAKQSVLERLPPSKPLQPPLEEGEAPLDDAAWAEAQKELTQQMTAAYGANTALTKKAAMQSEGSSGDQARGEYVPKARRTVRAKQNTQRMKRQMAGRPMGMGLPSARPKSGRKRGGSGAPSLAVNVRL